MKRTRAKAKAAVVSAARAVRLKKYRLPDDLEDVPEGFLRTIKHLKKPELQELARKLGLSSEGKVLELRQRIEHHYSIRKSALAPATEAVEQTDAAAELTSTGAEVTVAKGLAKIEAVDAAQTGNSESVPSARRPRKKWLVTDPLEIPPHYYHRDVFKANFPLIDVIDVPAGHSFPVRDKFEGVVLDEEVTEEARAIWISRVIDAARGYKVPENEKQAFPVHFAFFENLRMLTRPSRYDVEMHNSACGGKRKLNYEEIMNNGRAKLRKAETEDYEGMYLVPDGEDVVEPLAAGDYSGIYLAPEESADMTGELREDEDNATGFADGIVRIFAEPALDMTAGGNPDRVAAVLARKFSEDKFKWNARFQGGFYASKHAMENLRRGHGSAIYVILMTSSSWSYGILCPKGYVQVRDGSLRESSMDQFQKHQAMTKKQQGRTDDHTYETLQEKLRAGTEFYRSCYGDNPTAVYKDGPMLVAKFYLSSTWYNLPKPVCGGSKEEGGRRLFDGLLRLVLGDSVMDLSKQDFANRINLRERMKEEEVRSWLS